MFFALYFVVKLSFRRTDNVAIQFKLNAQKVNPIQLN